MAVFGDAEHLASWAGRCPGQYESAGKSKSGKARKGNKWLRTHLNEAATSAVRSEGTYSAAQYARIKGRRGHPKAWARCNTPCSPSVFYMLDRDVPYRDLGADYFTAGTTPNAAPSA